MINDTWLSKMRPFILNLSLLSALLMLDRFNLTKDSGTL